MLAVCRRAGYVLPVRSMCSAHAWLCFCLLARSSKNNNNNNNNNRQAASQPRGDDPQPRVQLNKALLSRKMPSPSKVSLPELTLQVTPFFSPLFLQASQVSAWGKLKQADFQVVPDTGMDFDFQKAFSLHCPAVHSAWAQQGTGLEQNTWWFGWSAMGPFCSANTLEY